MVDLHVEQVAFDVTALSATAPGAPEHTPAGAEIREFLLARWNRSCAYCGTSRVPLNIEHVRPRSRGGSNRVTNLVLACIPCNRAKGTTDISEFLSDRPSRLRDVLGQLARPLTDTAAVNTTRLLLVAALAGLGVPVHTWSGGLTAWNRSLAGLPKSHTLDALLVGALGHDRGGALVRVPAQVLVVRSTGRGSYARTVPDRHGFPRLRRPRSKVHHGFSTGDLVVAHVPRGKWAGRWVGRIAVRTSGQHSITTLTSQFDVSYRNLRLLAKGDGYAYGFTREKPVERGAGACLQWSHTERR